MRGLDIRRALRAIAALTVFCALFLPAQVHSAPQQARSFFIFFDYEKTEITPSAAKIIEIIKDGLKASSRVTITGHTDTAEPNADKLSLTRALEVEKALIALGVPAKVSFTIVGKAGSEPLVPTGPNVREPQNRRTAIEIR